MSHSISVLLPVVVYLMLPVLPASGQAYNWDCWKEQQEKLDAQLQRLSSTDQARHSGLIQAARQQAETMRTSGENLNRELKKAEDAAHKAIHDVQTKDSSYQRDLEALKQRRLEVRDVDRNPQPREVRRQEREEQQFALRNNSEARVVATPSVDQANGKTAALQRDSNRKEAEFYKQRLAVGVSDEHRPKALGDATKYSAEQLKLPTEVQRRVKENPAWADAMAAAAAAQAIARTGTLPGSLENAVGIAKSPFDDARRVVAEVAARELEGSMGLTEVGKAWGGRAELVDVRDKMGPMTREAVSAIGATSLLKLDQTVQAQRVMRDAIKKVPPPPIATADDSQVEKFVSGLGAAVKEGITKAKQIVHGPPIILPGGQK